MMTDPVVILIAAAGALVLGAAKTSFPTAAMLVIPILTLRLDARMALGILMPLYVFADVVAITSYRRGLNIATALRLLPGAAAGMLIAVVVGQHLSAEVFNRVLGALILTTVGLTVVLRSGANGAARNLPRWSVPIIGVAAGFATMIGNSGGPLVSIYLVLGGLANQSFVGTASIFYLLVNLTKIPLHLVVWQSVTWQQMLTVSAIVFPAALAGTVIGRWVLPRVPEEAFRRIVLTLTAVAAVRLAI
ncbi:MAG: sulfite exporter TauE/SafE family protein [Alkalispirochaeta sp.]